MQTRKTKLTFRHTYFSRSLPHVIFSFFVSGCCCYGTTAALQAFPFMTAANGASACGLVSMRACARGVNSVILLSANLYTRTMLTMPSSGTYQVYGSARGVKCNNCGKSFQFFTPLDAAIFQVQKQQQPSKRLGFHGITATHQAFPIVTATNGASLCGFVSVGICAPRVNSFIYTVVLKHKPYVALHAKFWHMYVQSEQVQFSIGGMLR